ncbi:MAG TPA: twin-arginine translocation signal domain-containing protein [Acidimicrobiales bacterium]|nr:twin-arginine translocation signal domain-containing protein [Acidimicrobiales bacterium]
MSREELSEAYAEARISRRAFIRGLAVAGGALGAVMLNVDAASAGHLEGSVGRKKAPAKKAPAKKATPKKATPKKAVGKKTTTAP